jgi:hypothetical protein
MDVAFEEGFLAGRGEHPVDGLARIRQTEGEQVAGPQLAGQSHAHVAEVDLGMGSRAYPKLPDPDPAWS